MSRLLGIDLGTRRIGVALGDTTTGQARPLVTLARRGIEHDAASLRRLALEQGVQELVVGLPLSLDGSEGPQATYTRDWAAAIARLTGLCITWQDERHTSQDAEHRLGGPGRGRAGGPPSAAALRSYRARVDREAATAIVQAALDVRPATAAVPA
ncbi:MAG: Holliday junction resolvase RuvX [Chloroflexi bacterium]|nr:Holliday junction resolvase RuvX [Chloroflexota bacterium]